MARPTFGASYRPSGLLRVLRFVIGNALRSLGVSALHLEEGHSQNRTPSPVGAESVSASTEPEIEFWVNYQPLGT
jgi:hypothetical protein